MHAWSIWCIYADTKYFVTKLFHALEDSTIMASIDDIEGRNHVDATTTIVVYSLVIRVFFKLVFNDDSM